MNLAGFCVFKPAHGYEIESGRGNICFFRQRLSSSRPRLVTGPLGGGAEGPGQGGEEVALTFCPFILFEVCGSVCCSQSQVV